MANPDYSPTDDYSPTEDRLLCLIEQNNGLQRKLLESMLRQQSKLLVVFSGLVLLVLTFGIFAATRTTNTTVTYTDESKTTYTSECRTGFLSFGRCGDSHRREDK